MNQAPIAAAGATTAQADARRQDGSGAEILCVCTAKAGVAASATDRLRGDAVSIIAVGRDSAAWGAGRIGHERRLPAGYVNQSPKGAPDGIAVAAGAAIRTHGHGHIEGQGKRTFGHRTAVIQRSRQRRRVAARAAAAADALDQHTVRALAPGFDLRALRGGKGHVVAITGDTTSAADRDRNRNRNLCACFGHRDPDCRRLRRGITA
ncbi:hypothetical protein D3C87_1114050 [compost metagenome]